MGIICGCILTISVMGWNVNDFIALLMEGAAVHSQAETNDGARVTTVSVL